MVKRIVTTFLFLILTSVFLGMTCKPAFSATNDCIPATGAGLSCTAPKSVRCPVGGPGGGGVLCCSTQQECTNKTTQITQQQKTTGTTQKVCDFAGAKKPECESCMGAGTAAWTALGCIQTSPQLFLAQFLKIGIGIGGGVAFLLILFGGFQILTSAGNPEKLAAGREVVTSAITGLLIIIFSVFILRLIGVDIFGIPEFQ